MSESKARYDGYADWYDETTSHWPKDEETGFLRDHLGAGRGEVCLDIGCGTGRYGAAVAAAGYRAVGVDLSRDQLRFARRRLAAAVCGDGRRLPARDGAVPVAVGMYFHTDVADFAGVVREVARCLRPGGRFLYVGLHPCFLGPFVYRLEESAERGLTFMPGYGQVGWASRGSGDGTHVAGRVGFHHKTLESFLSAIIQAGLCLREVRELSGNGTVLPRNLGLVAEKRH